MRSVLKWLALALFSYPATALIVKQPWKEILYATVVPHIELTFAFFFIITGVFGTSISPYMFFWQASEEVEEEREVSMLSGRTRRTTEAAEELHSRYEDRHAGWHGVGGAAQWFIIITTATVLFKHGKTTINTAADAAKALEPLVQSFPNSGQVAKDLFAVGVIGLGLLAIPVLAGRPPMQWLRPLAGRKGLSKKFKKAPRILWRHHPVDAHRLAAEFHWDRSDEGSGLYGGFQRCRRCAVAFSDREDQWQPGDIGEHRGGVLSRTFVWVTFGVMGLSAVALLYTLVFRHSSK